MLDWFAVWLALHRGTVQEPGKSLEDAFPTIIPLTPPPGSKLFDGPVFRPTVDPATQVPQAT